MSYILKIKLIENRYLSPNGLDFDDNKETLISLLGFIEIIYFYWINSAITHYCRDLWSNFLLSKSLQGVLDVVYNFPDLDF